jgi:hypothetical protein
MHRLADFSSRTRAVPKKRFARFRLARRATQGGGASDFRFPKSEPETNMRIRNLTTPLVCILLLTAFALSARAQGTASRVTGVVTDSAGAVVEGATVMLTNDATKISFNTQTTSAGAYVFESVQVGVYTVTVEKAGFRRVVSSANQVNVNQPATIDVTLEAGNVEEVVNVQASVELVQTSSSGNFGNTVEERPLVALPLVGSRGRNPINFLNFQPGVVNGANSGGGVHVHGARDRAFNFTLDGIDINETSAGGSNFTPLRPNPDSITQFQVVTGNFTAELGRSSGAQVTLVTKSGTNEFHGNIFDYYQTPRFQANEYQNKINTIRAPDGSLIAVPRPQFVQHIFGGSVGGPIIKNKTFFFTNLQLLRTSQSIFVNRTVYTADARAGRFRFVRGGLNSNITATTPSVDGNGNLRFPVCAAGVASPCIETFSLVNNANIPLSLDPTTGGLIGQTPLPNNFVLGDGLNTGGFAFNAPQTERQHDFTFKIDHTFNERHSMYVRWAQGQQNTICDNANGGLARFPGLPCFVDTFRDPKNLAVNYRATLSPTTVNEFIVGFNRFTFSFNNPDPNADQNSPIILNIPTDPLNSSPAINNARRLTTFQVIDNISHQRGAHTLKFGTNLRFQRHFDDRSSVANFNTRESVTLTTGDNAVPTSFGTRGSATTGINLTDRGRLESYVNDLLGRYGRIVQAFVATDNTAFGAPGTRFLNNAKYDEYDFFGQDTWKVRPNLTLDYGLRWEMRLSPRASQIILKPSQPVRFGVSSTNQISFDEGKLYDDSLFQFAPTVGMAWDPFGDGKTSLRANYRLAWDRTNTFVFSSFIFQNAPGLTRGVTLTASDLSGGPNTALVRNGLPVLNANDRTPLQFRTPPPYDLGSTNVVDPDLTYPRTHQYGVSFQREVGWNSVIEINYIGRLGRKLFGAYDANQVDVNNNGFLTAFRQLQARASNNDPIVTDPNFLINRLLAGDSRLGAGQTGAQFLLAQAVGGNVRLADGRIVTNIVDAGSVAQAAFLITQGTRIVSGVRTPQFQINGFSPFFFQPFPQFTGALNVLDNNDHSRYDALEIQFSRRFNRGVGFQISYTMAKSMDTRSFDPALTLLGRSAAGTAATFLSSNTPYDIHNREANYARSDFDRKHALQGYFAAELPFGHGRTYLNNLNPVLDRVVGGWELAGILQLYSGRPFTVLSGISSVSQVVQSPASCNRCSPGMGGMQLFNGRNVFFTPDEQTVFFAPPAGELGNLGRNFFTGPKQFQLDMTLTKRIRFTESLNLELRAEAQNITNTPAFDFPTAVISNAAFGQVNGAVVSSSRKVQLAAKFNF